MTQRAFMPFTPVYGTSEPSFNSSAFGATSHSYAVESTVRKFQGPSYRSLRLVESSGAEYRVNFGDSSVVANTTASMLVLGGVEVVFTLTPDVTHVAFVSSTTVTVNVTPGYGA